MLKQVATYGFTVDDNEMLSLYLMGNPKFTFRGASELDDLKYVDILLVNINSRTAIENLPIKTIKENFPKTSVLVTGKFVDLKTVEGILKAGANGYILNSMNFLDQVISGLHEISNGGGPLSPKIAKALVKSLWVNKSRNSQISESEANLSGSEPIKISRVLQRTYRD